MKKGEGGENEEEVKKRPEMSLAELQSPLPSIRKSLRELTWEMTWSDLKFEKVTLLTIWGENAGVRLKSGRSHSNLL